MTGPTREDVERRWKAVIDGTLTREEVHAWAAPWVDGDEDFDDLIVGLGLQYLHGFDLSTPPDNDGLLHHGGGAERVYIRSTGDVATELERWREDARAFDQNPAAWRRARFELPHRNLVQEGNLDAARRIEAHLRDLDDSRPG